MITEWGGWMELVKLVVVGTASGFVIERCWARRASRRRNHWRTRGKNYEARDAGPKRPLAERRMFLLTDDEQRFCCALREAVGDFADVHFRTDVSRIVSLRRSFRRFGLRHSAGRQQVKFVLTKRCTSYVLVAIELDDDTRSGLLSHWRKRSLEGLLRSAGVPVVRFWMLPSHARYDVTEMRTRLERFRSKARSDNWGRTMRA